MCIQELGGADLQGWMVLAILAKFLYLFAASLALGLIFGLGTSFLMKTFPLNSVPQVRRESSWSEAIID